MCPRILNVVVLPVAGATPFEDVPLLIPSAPSSVMETVTRGRSFVSTRSMSSTQTSLPVLRISRKASGDAPVESAVVLQGVVHTPKIPMKGEADTLVVLCSDN